MVDLDHASDAPCEEDGGEQHAGGNTECQVVGHDHDHDGQHHDGGLAARGTDDETRRRHIRGGWYSLSGPMQGEHLDEGVLHGSRHGLAPNHPRRQTRRAPGRH